MILRFSLFKPVFCSGFLLCLLSLLLVTCAPIPKEGESRQQAEVTLTLQHRADRLARAGTASRLTEFIVVVPGGTPFLEQGPANPLASGLLNLQIDQVTLQIDLDTPLRLFVYRYAENLSLAELQSRLETQSLDSGAIDFGKTADFEILSDSTTDTLDLTVLLQREAVFLDAAVEGLQVQTIDGTQSTDADGMFVYFPEENVQLSLGELSLGSFTNPVLLTPYSIFGVPEGDSANNVINLVRLLMTLDGDGNPDNGIQLSAAGVSQLGALNLADFDTSPESFDGRVSGLALVGVQQARQHLLQLLQQKNNPLTVSSFLPLDNGSLATLDTSIFVEFSEPLRQSSIEQDSALTLQNGSTLVAGSLSVQNNQLSFKPSNPLTPNTSYTVTLDTNLSDQDGKPLSGTRGWTFQTGELASAPGLKVLNTSPENQATEVPLNSTLVIYFPEAVLAQSEELWILEGGGTEIACKSRVTENAVYCQPQQDLLAETVYTLTLLPNLVDKSGSPLSEAFVLNFTTGTSRFSAETFLRHRGDFTDNYTNSPNITLLLSSANENSLRYQVTDQSVAPSSAGSGWQTPLGYPVEVPFKLSESSSGSSTTLTAWFDDGEELVEQVSLGLVYDSVSPSGQLEFAQSSPRDAEVGITLSTSDQLSPIAWYLIKLDNLTPALDAEDWIPLETGSLEAAIGLTMEIDNSQERTLPLYGWVLDAAGNLSDVFSDQVLIDLSTPEASLALELEPYLNTESLRLELKVEDNSGGELFYMLSKDQQAPEVVDVRWQAYLVGEPIEWDLTGEKEGTLNLYLWVRDQVGNLAQRLELHTVIDRTPPMITELLVDGGDNYTNSKEIELSWLAIDNLSGVAEFYLAEIADTLPEAAAWLDYDPAKESYPYTLTNTSNGQKSITLFVRDQAGNIAQQTASITFDNLGPAAAVGTLPTYFNGDTLNVSLSVDEVMAEARSYWLSSTNQSPDNNSNWTAFSGSNLTLTLDFSASNGLQQRFLWLKDYLGNTSGPTILETTIDRLGPQISQLQLNGGAAYTNSSTLSLNWTATDDISGVAGFMVSNSSASPASWNTISAGTHSTSFTLSNLQQGSKTLYLHVQDQAKNTSTSTASIIFDIQTPVGFLTLPHTTNQASLPFLVMAFDNLSGAQSYQIQPAATPAPIDSDWTDFPNPPMNADNRSYFWDNVTTYNPEWQCTPLSDLQGFVHGTFDPGTNANQESHLPCDDPSIASFDNFSTLLPAWDNQTFTFANLDNSSPQAFKLWIQDRAGNTWQYSEVLEIRFDNQSPDTSQATLLLDNGSLPPVDHYLNLHLFRNYQGDNDTELKLRFSTTDNDTRYVRAQLDNNTTPDPYDLYHWWPLDNNTFDNRTLWLPLDNASSVQEHSLYLRLKDEAGNIDNLTPKNIYWAQLHDGNQRLDNQSSPVANRYAALTLKYPQALSSSYPLEQLRVSRSSDNQTVSGQWNLDHDSLVFWMEGPLQPEQGYRLEVSGHVDNLSLYASQVFHFQSDNQTLDLNQGLVSYYPLDENPPVERQNQETAVANGGPSLTRDRFNREYNSFELDGVDDYVKGITNTKLPFGNSKRSLCAWIRSNDDNNGMPVRYGDDVTNGGFGIYLNDSDQWSLWKHNSDINSGISDNSRWNLHCLLYDQNYLKYYYNLQNVIDQSILSLNTASSDNLTIGWSHDSHYFRGKLDEIRVYNRPLQIVEIKALYAVADPYPPEITSSKPANNETGFSVADNLTITFDKPLDGSTIQASSVELRRSDNTTVAGNLYLDPNDNRSLIFDPIDNLSSLTNYTLYLHSSIRDFIGNSISPTQIPFQTQILGGGSATDPFLISNEEGLREIIKNMNAHYTLTNNIILTKVWTPLGTSTNKFNGSINGDNYTISNLIIDNQTDNFTGFFRFVSGTIKDLKFKDAYIQGYERVGLLSGKQTSGSISHIEIDNLTVVGLHSKSGGIIGESFGSISKISIKNLNLSGQDSAGGLVGRMAAGSIQLSSVMGNVAGDYKVGGLVGNLDNGSITNSYALTDITDSSGGSGIILGGITGRYSGAGPIKNSFAVGSIAGGTTIGGVVGDNDSGGSVINTYYNRKLAQNSFNTIGDNRTGTQLKHTLTSTDIVDGAQTYTGWDFVNVWDAGSACDYPRLRWQNEPLQVSCVLHDGSDNTTSASRSAEIQIGFNRPVDNSTLTSGGSVKFVPPIGLDNFSYDNTSQILTLQPAEPLLAGNVYTIQFQNIRSADQQSIIDNFTHTFTTSQLGATWIQATANADFPPVNSARLETFQDKLWLLGGNDPSVSNQVWTSENGKDWTQAITSTQTDAMWGVRNTHASATFQDKLWVLGGNSGTAANPNPIWSSADGLTWAKTENVNWSQRWRNSTVVFNNRIWVIGGYNNGWKNDAWSSVDGTNWSQESSQVWSTSGAESTAVVFDGKIWMLGGWDAGGLINTIRNSTDGKTWQTVTPQVPIWESRWDHQAIVFDNKIWVLGGEERGPNTNHNDVWYSTDGINWVEVTPSANWSVRSRFTSTIFENKIWIATGDNGAGQRFNDVWYTEGSGLIVASMRDNATDVSLTPELWMRLSYPVQPTFVESNNFFLQFDNGTLVSGTSLLDPDNTTVRFIPDGPLEANSHYSLIASTGLKRQSDNKSVFQSNRLLRFTTHPDLDTDPALVLYLPFKGNANDLSAQQNDGTNYSASLVSDRFGNFSSAYLFNGNSYIEIQDNDSLDFWPNQDFTIHFWLKTDSCTSISGLDVDLISKWDTNGTSNYPYSVRCSQDGSIIGIKYASGIANPFVKSVSKVNDDRYHSVSFVSNGNTLKLFIDGKIDNSLSSSLAPNVQNNSSLFIGKRSSSNTNNFTGILDDIRIYSRALSEHEISSLSKELSRGLLSSYSMDNLNDLTGENDLVLKDGEYTISEDRFGEQGAALFNGDDALRSSGNLSNLVSGNHPRTLVYWQRLDQLNGSYQHVVSWGGETAQPFGSYINVTDGKFGYWNGSANLLTSHVSPLGQWQQWALTYHSNGLNEVFLNGNLIASKTQTLNTTPGKLYLGKKPIGIDSTPYYFQGALDEILIYDRVLSVSEIKALQNVRDPLPPVIGSVLINNGADNTSIDSLTLTLSSRDASAIVAYQITDNGSFAGLPWRSDNLTPSDNVSFQTSFTLGSSDFGERQIEVRFKDEAGNISKPFGDNITRLDTTPPQPLSFSLVGTAGNDNFSNSDNVSFIDNATDDVAPVGMYLSENSTTPLDNAPGWQAYANTGTFQLSAGQGEKQVYLWFKDAANNISSYLTDTITLDNVSPTANGILINSGADNTTSSTVILSFDNVTGASHYFATDNASAPTPTATAQGWKLYPAINSDNFTLTGTGNREVRIWFRDEAGNLSGVLSDNIIRIVVGPWTFTNAGATGSFGPTQAQIDSAYSSTNLAGKVTINIQGIQEWTVPTTGTYRVEVWGGSGGNYTYISDTSLGGTGGGGSQLKGDLLLDAGTILKILVGQSGEIINDSSQYGGAGGGGGSFVVTGNNPLVIAGGGSGAAGGSGQNNGQNGRTTTNGGHGLVRSGSNGSDSSSGGSNGAKGEQNTLNSQIQDPGAGYSGSSTATASLGTVTNSPNSFLNGGDGQNESGSLAYGSGGFGGGAAGSERKGGAAGGYSGGGTISTEGTAGHYGTGGSGGSYILSSATNIATSNGLYNNSSSFNGASITNLNSYNSGHGKIIIIFVD